MDASPLECSKDGILSVKVTGRFIDPSNGLPCTATKESQSRQTFVAEKPMIGGTKTEDVACRPVSLPIRNFRKFQRVPLRGFKEMYQTVTRGLNYFRRIGCGEVGPASGERRKPVKGCQLVGRGVIENGSICKRLLVSGKTSDRRRDRYTVTGEKTAAKPHPAKRPTRN
ncbi:hypothetical protein TNCV_2411461 [Trichonephila clavipes]|nr:hypothetical protein TNCV_2411461 [Trichonephila clavipes]